MSNIINSLDVGPEARLRYKNQQKNNITEE